MCEDSVSWLFRLERNFSWHSGLPFTEDRVYRDAKGKVRLILERGGLMTVTGGYAWNGCSPKVCCLDFLIGTPDGVVSATTGRPKTYFASLVHDALYQFLAVGTPVTRRDADGCFFRLMEESRFSPRYIYWLAVRAFGWLVWKGKMMARHWAGERVDLPLLPRNGSEL